MAPLNLPPPALTLEEATELATAMEQQKQFQQQSFRGSALQEFLAKENLLETKYKGKTVDQIGQALMEQRLVHHVSDDEDFSVHGEFRLISQETFETRAFHIALSNLIRDSLVTGNILVLRSHFLGLHHSFEPVFGVLSNDKLRLFKRKSAASVPLNEYSIKDMSQLRECVDCKKDWYCFTISMRNGSKLTLCADHSKRQEGWMTALTNLGLDYAQLFDEGTTAEEISKVQSIFELKARRLNSKEVVNFSEFKGNVCMVVNVSTLCGLTPQYADLQKLEAKYHDRGFRILAFPVNQFNNQEPGTEPEIAEFAKSKFGVTFDMFEKTDCNGKNAHPVFRFVKAKLNGVLGSSVKWNFTKFLCDRDGIPVKRFAPTTTPMSFENDIVELLDAKAVAQQ